MGCAIVAMFQNIDNNLETLAVLQHLKIIVPFNVALRLDRNCSNDETFVRRSDK